MLGTPQQGGVGTPMRFKPAESVALKQGLFVAEMHDDVLDEVVAGAQYAGPVMTAGQPRVDQRIGAPEQLAVVSVDALLAGLVDFLPDQM